MRHINEGRRHEIAGMVAGGVKATRRRSEGRRSDQSYVIREVPRRVRELVSAAWYRPDVF